MRLFEILELQLEVIDILKEDLRFPLRYKLNKVMNKIQPEQALFVESRNQLLDTLGCKDTGITDEHPQYVKFISGIENVLNSEIEIDLGMLPLSDFEDIKTDKMYNRLMGIIAA